jgi:Cu-Zn family superoxide dismutase
MKKAYILMLTFTLIFAISCKNEKKETEQKVEEVVVKEDIKVESKKLIVDLTPKSDSNVSGKAVFTEDNGSVTMVALLKGLDVGTHAIHLHEKSDCSSADGKSSGGHWNPTSQPHGKWGAAEGFHKGDIGNFEANANGNGSITFTTDQWCIGCGDKTKDIVGKAIIVHQGTDDFKSQPSGAAGTRVSCGGIIQ